MKTVKNSGVRAFLCAIVMSLTFSITCRAAEGVAPAITAQPESQTATVGGSASFSVSATGTLPLTYRWLRNGIVFTNFVAVNSYTSTLTLDNVQFAVATFRVQVTNLYGALPSFTVHLQVVQPPTNQSASAGGTVLLAAKVAGGNSPSYQWRFSGTNLPDATSTNLVLTNVQPTQAGIYTFVTTHSGGTSKAFDASLTITEPDTDGDGIPDEWEDGHGLNKNSAADADLDPDGDRLSNLGEYIAGTNPTNSASVLKFERIITGATTTLEFGAVSNKTYTIQCADILPAATWTKVADVLAGMSNRLEIITNLPTAPQRFYRLITPRQP